MIKKYKKTISVLLVLSVFLVLLVLSVSAQELTYPEIAGEAPTEDTTLPEYIKYIFNFSLILGAILAVTALLFGGIRWFFSLGSPSAISEAKSWMLAGILGLVLLLSSYLILTTINPELAILKLEELEEFEPVEPPEYVPPEIETTYYQEIPIGLLIENILAKNYNYDEEAEMVVCYDYDEEGNMIDQNGDGDITEEDLLKDHDRLNCIELLLAAIEIKSEKLKILSEELQILSEDLKDESEELKKLAEKCNCARCSQDLQNIGCGSCTCPCGDCNPCNCQGDPCPDRAQMNNLRRNIIPPIIKALEEKRIEINAFIYGADLGDKYIYYEPNSHLGDPIEKGYHIDEWDPNVTPTFLTYEEAILRFKWFKDDLIQDLNDYLKEAEELAKFPYGQRITLAKFMDKKSRKKIDKIEFEGFDIARYCRIFNCLSETDGICTEYGLNTEGEYIGRLCNIYNLDGEPATFYFPKEEYE